MNTRQEEVELLRTLDLSYRTIDVLIDDTRAWGPPYAKYLEGEETKGPGESAYYLGVSVLQTRLN